MGSQTDRAQKMENFLNANASEFVPRFYNDNCEISSHEQMYGNKGNLNGDELASRKEPKLVLPWKGFPKPLRPERPSNPIQPKIDILVDSNTASKKSENDTEIEKRLEQERKKALEALILANERRMRECANQMTQPIVHLSREHIEYSPEERLEVDELRLAKQKHIELMLKQMNQEKQEIGENSKVEIYKECPENNVMAITKSSKENVGGSKITSQSKTTLKTIGRYVCLQRATKPQSQAEAITSNKIESQIESQSDTKTVEVSKARRYIPTEKEWNERFKAKENLAPEITFKIHPDGKLEVKTETTIPRRRPFGQWNKSNIPIESHKLKVDHTEDNHKEMDKVISKTSEIYIPCYIASNSEDIDTRRGNRTHSRSISSAFPSSNLVLLPTPDEMKGKFVELPDKSNKFIKRYGLEELLKMEPQPQQLMKPKFKESHSGLGFINN